MKHSVIMTFNLKIKGNIECKNYKCLKNSFFYRDNKKSNFLVGIWKLKK